MYPEPQGLTCNPEDGQLAQEEQLQALKVGPALGVKGQVKAPPSSCRQDWVYQLFVCWSASPCDSATMSAWLLGPRS